MKPIKIRVRSPEHSVRIQKMLFGVGCYWGVDTQVVQEYDESFLYVKKDGSITHSTAGDDNYFDEHPHREVDLDWLLPERETIEIPGVGTFYKDELVKRVKNLERVK